jgi:hypothetical protein
LQHRSKHSFGPWTEAISETVRSIGAAHQAIKVLQDKFTSHVDDLRMVDETRDSVRQLKEECRGKSEVLRRQADTVITRQA